MGHEATAVYLARQFRGQVKIVGHQHQSALFLSADLTDQGKNIFSRGRVKSAGRFISQKKSRAVGDGAGNGNPLPFADRQTARPSVQSS